MSNTFELRIPDASIELTKLQLEATLHLLEPQLDEVDYGFKNAQFQDIKAALRAYDSNGGSFYEGAFIFIGRDQYDSIKQYLSATQSGPVTVIG